MRRSSQPMHMCPVPAVRRSTFIIVSASAVVSGLMFLSGCSDSPPNDTSTDEMVESAISDSGLDIAEIAAVVGGRVITQKQIDASIAASRVRLGLKDDDDWADYLTSYGLEEWDVRASTIKNAVDDVLVELQAEELGIDVSQDVETRVKSIKALYPTMGAFIDAIEDKGYTEKSYTQAVRRNELWNALREEVVSEPQPTEDQIRQYAVVVAPTLVGRRASHILIASSDYALTVRVLNKIEDGADFAEMAMEYSIDSTAKDGGDVGWDSVNTFIPVFQETLSNLEPGEVSGIVRSRFGYHIIKCTDKYDCPLDEDGNVDISAIPDDLMDIIIQSMSESLMTQLFEVYISNLEATTPIAVFDAEGNQVPPGEVGLATEVQQTEVDVDDVIDDVQSTVQAAVEQGVAFINFSVGVSTSATQAASDPTALEDYASSPINTSATDSSDLSYARQASEGNRR